MQRYDIINKFIEMRGYTSYLELGVQNPNQCFNRIVCEHKEGVDVDYSANATHTMTSDEFFATIAGTYDIVFVDALHTSTAVEKDAQNALKCLNPNGVIIFHDCLPKTETEQLEEMQSGDWVGTVWKFWVCYRKESPFKTYTINTDHGVGIIETSRRTDYDELGYIPEKLDWGWFCKYGRCALGLVDDIQ